MEKSVQYKKEMTELQLFKVIHKYIKGYDDIKISVMTWDNIDYTGRWEVDDLENNLQLEIYIELNDKMYDNTESFYLVEIPQSQLPQEQYDATSKKLLKDCIKIGEKIKAEFNTLYNYDDKLKKVEIKIYDTLQVC